MASMITRCFRFENCGMEVGQVRTNRQLDQICSRHRDCMVFKLPRASDIEHCVQRFLAYFESVMVA